MPAPALTLTSESIASCVSPEQSAGCAIWAPMNELPPPPLHATWPNFLLKPIWPTIMRATRDTCGSAGWGCGVGGREGGISGREASRLAGRRGGP